MRWLSALFSRSTEASPWRSAAELPRHVWIDSALVASALVLSAMVFVDQERPGPRELSARTGLVLQVFREQDATRLSFRRGQDSFELIRSADAWALRGQRSAEARTEAVDALLRTLATARPLRVLGKVSATERPAFGLDVPRVELEISMRGVSARLRLGITAPGEGSYLEVVAGPDQPGGVYVVTADLAALLDRDADAYRDPSLVGARWVRQAARLELGLGPRVVLERGPHETFRLALPDGGWLRAEPDAVQSVLGTLAELTADPLLDDTMTPTPERGRVVVRSSEGEVRVVRFGGGCPGATGRSIVQVHVDQVDGPVRATGCVPTYAIERLERPAESFYDTHVLALPAGSLASKSSEVQSIVVSKGGQKVLDVERSGDGLHVRLPADLRAEREPTERWMERLVSLRCRFTGRADVAQPSPLGPAAEVRTVDVVRSILSPELSAQLDGGISDASPLDPSGWSQRISIGPTRPASGSQPAPDALQRVTVLREDDQAMLDCPADALRMLGPSAVADLRSGALLTLKPSAISRLVVRQGARALWELKRTQGVTELVFPLGLGADPAVSSQLFEQLATPSCLRWLEPSHAPSNTDVPASESFEIDIEAERNEAKGNEPGGPLALHLRLGQELPEGVVANVAGSVAADASSCVVSKALADLVAQVPADRGALAFDPSTTPTLVVRRAKTERTIVWSEASRSFSDASGDAEPSPVRVGQAHKLADALVGLRAEGVLYVGPPRPDDGMDLPTLTVEGRDDGGHVRKTLVVGARGRDGATPVYRVRVSDHPATYLVLREDVDRLLQLL